MRDAWVRWVWMLLLVAAWPTWAADVPAHGAPLVITKLGEPLVELGGPWQFHFGDDAHWASPAFDDAQWAALRTDEGWDVQGYPATGGFGWYRRHIHFAGSAAAGLSLALPAVPVQGAYEVFWNGVPIGGCGEMPPHYRLVTCWDPVALPQGAGAKDALVAYRVFSTSNKDITPPGEAGLLGTPQLGSVTAVGANREQLLYETLRSEWVLNAVGLLYALAALLLGIAWLLDRTERLYMWLMLFLAIKALRSGLSVWFDIGGVVWQWNLLLLFLVGYGCLFAALWMLLLRLFHLDASALWRRATVWMIAVCLLVHASTVALGLAWTQWGWSPAPLLVLYAFSAGITLYSLVLIVAGLRRRAGAARWAVAITATFGVLVPVARNACQIFQQWRLADRIDDAALGHLWGGTVTVTTVSDFSLLLALCYAAVQTLLESRRHRLETELELRSAAEVQQVLLPEQTPGIAGFTIRAVYRPAGELGGDFFQVVPLEDGGVLVVVGDVSGKGMPAAMTVSLLVGTVRTLADYTRSPGAMLAGMNQRMIGRSNGGFTTCLALRITPDGQMTVANAGHLQPYVDGVELAVDPGLPLGLLDGAAYEELRTHLQPGSQLTLLTDGVVEARSVDGELFGFERTAEIAGETADAIAEAGVRFGQSDDITVLTLALA